MLALDTLRAIESAGGFSVIEREAHFILQGVRQPDLLRISARVERALERVRLSLESAGDAAEAGARRAALTTGRAFALALLARQAQWSLEHERDERPLAAARRFAAAGINLLGDYDAGDARRLARDEP